MTPSLDKGTLIAIVISAGSGALSLVNTFLQRWAERRAKVRSPVATLLPQRFPAATLQSHSRTRA